MSGFMDGSLNREIASSTFSYIVSKVMACLEKMIDDYSNDSNKIANKENEIRDHLFSKYLNNDEVMRNMGFDDFRFFSETPENYINGHPQGRTDLHVISIHEFRHRKKYFTIECKRLDGNLTLNRKYISEGIQRFLGESPKYTSFNQVNGMLGFVVKCIDIASNVEKINSLLQASYPENNVKEYLHYGIVPNTYISTHNISENELLVLIHAFVDCSSLVVRDEN